MFAETVGILAGTTGAMAWWKVTLAGAAGNRLWAVAYAAVGAYASTFINGALVFAAGWVIAATAWLVQRRPLMVMGYGWWHAPDRGAHGGGAASGRITDPFLNRSTRRSGVSCGESCDGPRRSPVDRR